MTKTILLTGATDGIGFETALKLRKAGHTLLIHGRSAEKLDHARIALEAIPNPSPVIIYQADLMSLADVDALAEQVKTDHTQLDVLINNAGVFKTSVPQAPNGYDSRFMVNAVAPYRLTEALLGLMPTDGRVVNLSSAAQAPVDVAAMTTKAALADSPAYAQSKLAITMWSFYLAQRLGTEGPAIIAVNPASFLGSKMVKDAYGMDGKDLSVGADILLEAALSSLFADASGRYFDNDSGQFTDPHPDALDPAKNRQVVAAIEAILADLESS